MELATNIHHNLGGRFLTVGDTSLGRRQVASIASSSLFSNYPFPAMISVGEIGVNPAVEHNEKSGKGILRSTELFRSHNRSVKSQPYYQGAPEYNSREAMNRNQM
jgi:hypothetical protein